MKKYISIHARKERRFEIRYHYGYKADGTSNYQYIVSARIIPRFAKIKKETLSIEHITAFITDLFMEGLREKTVKDILIILQQILKFGNIEINFPMPKIPKREIQIFQKEEQAQLEIMRQTKTTLLKYKKALEETNHPLAEDIQKYAHGARCTFPDYTCASICNFEEGKKLTRRI